MHRRAALWICAGAGIWIRLCARVLRGADGWCGDRVWWWGLLLAGEVIGLKTGFPRASAPPLPASMTEARRGTQGVCIGPVVTGANEPALSDSDTPRLPASFQTTYKH